MKSRRQNDILSLIEKYVIETQEDLQNRLKELGYDVTQATISRDIRELKLTKMATEDGRQKYSVMYSDKNNVSEKYIRVLHDALVSVDTAQNLLVLKTVAGMAMAVAAAVDSLHLDGVVGCIAGDDTIFCAVRTVEDTFRVADRIKKLTSGKK
jgi:transcriptional regulator of arginine metabolism